MVLLNEIVPLISVFGVWKTKGLLMGVQKHKIIAHKCQRSRDRRPETVTEITLLRHNNLAKHRTGGHKPLQNHAFNLPKCQRTRDRRPETAAEIMLFGLQNVVELSKNTRQAAENRYKT